MSTEVTVSISCDSCGCTIYEETCYDYSYSDDDLETIVADEGGGRVSVESDVFRENAVGGNNVDSAFWCEYVSEHEYELLCGTCYERACNEASEAFEAWKRYTEKPPCVTEDATFEMVTIWNHSEMVKITPNDGSEPFFAQIAAPTVKRLLCAGVVGMKIDYSTDPPTLV